MRLLLFLLLCASAAAQSNTFTNGRLFFISFDYVSDVFPSNITFRVHASQNIGIPVEQWDVLTTNLAEVVTGDYTKKTFETAQSFPAYLPIQFYIGSASNEWGEIFFTEVFATAPPRGDSRLRLR